MGSGHLRPEAQTIRDLEREVRELREENAILKKPFASLRTPGSEVPVHPQAPFRVPGAEDVRCTERLPKWLLRVDRPPRE